MDYALLTAVHPRTSAPAKMDAKQEQEYYDRAAASQALPEKLVTIIKGVRHMAAALVDLTQATGKGPSHGLNARKALH